MKTEQNQVQIRKQTFNGFSSGLPGSEKGESFAGWEVVVNGSVVGSYRDEREAQFVAGQFGSWEPA